MTYDEVVSLSQTAGLIFFLILFLGVIAYVFWPRNKAKFDRAAHLPLDEE